MANLNKQEKIGKAYVEQHSGKEANIDNWYFGLPLDCGSKKEKYAQVYINLIGGVYGECRGVNAEYDDDGEEIKEPTEFENEISECNIFTFEI